MFGLCGKHAKYDGGDINVGDEYIQDLITEEEPLDNQAKFDIKTGNALFRSILLNMLSPGAKTARSGVRESCAEKEEMGNEETQHISEMQNSGIFLTESAQEERPTAAVEAVQESSTCLSGQEDMQECASINIFNPKARIISEESIEPVSTATAVNLSVPATIYSENEHHGESNLQLSPHQSPYVSQAAPQKSVPLQQHDTANSHLQYDIKQLINSQGAESKEIESLRTQLEQQQQLFEQQMELVRMQQQRLLEQEERDRDTKEVILELKSQLSMQQRSSPAVYGHHDIEASTGSGFKRYHNAKLSLTSNSLCGFDGREKLFEINLGEPDVVEFEPEQLKIIVQHKDGPISIRADSRENYTKWSQNIQKCIDSARQGVSQKGIIMKLDKNTKQLLVYKGDTQHPTKTFNVGGCIVEVRAESHYASLKVRCVDGRKFSFGDKLEVCQQWIQKFSDCGGRIEYL